MLKNILKVSLLILFGVGSLLANEVEVNINNHVVEVQVNTNLNQYYELDNANDYFINIGILHEDKGTPNLFNVGLKAATSEFDAQNVDFGLGVGLLASSKDSNSFIAIPFSIDANVHVNDKILVTLSGAYSPSVLSFSKADKFTSLKATLNYQLLNNGYIFIGIRDITATYNVSSVGKIDYDDSVFLGYRVKF